MRTSSLWLTWLVSFTLSAQAGLSIRWGVDLEFKVGQRIWFNGSLYEALEPHRGDRARRPDGDARHWRPVSTSEQSSLRFLGEWRDGRRYERGVRIVFEGQLFECLGAHQVRRGEAWDRHHWRPVAHKDWHRHFDDEDRPAPERHPRADVWREGPSYQRGEVIRHRGRQYRCLQSHRAHRGAGWSPDAAPALWEELR